MIETVSILQGSEYVSAISFSESNDSLTIKSSSPLIGLKSISEVSEVLVGEDESNYFQKAFKYTVDGVNWSEFQELSTVNLQNISNIKKNHFFNVEYRYVRVGESANPIYFVNVSLIGEYEDQPQPDSYTQTSYNKFFPFFNIPSINWSLNVLEKIVKKGIVPGYIVRNENNNWDDEDYINLWWVIIYMNALTVTYNNIFTEILYRPELLRDFLQQNKIITGPEKDLGELYYLANYKWDEILRRGGLSILDKQRVLPDNYINVSVQGELLRLIGWSEEDEFIFNKINVPGWYINLTSPMFDQAQPYVNLVKGYENTKSIEDLSKYPVYGATPTLVSDTVGESDMQVMRLAPQYIVFEGSTLTDPCGFNGDLSKSVVISPYFNYEISFKIKKETLDHSDIYFGVNGFDFYGNSVNFIKLSDFNQTTNLFSDNLVIEQINKYYHFSAIIFSLNEVEERESKINTGEGDNLRFLNSSIRRISPLIIYNSKSPVRIADFKIRMYSHLPQISLDMQNTSSMYYRQRNPQYTNQEVERRVERDLIPFNTKIQFNQYGN